MELNTHLHERIARATNRLAQLQAHELIAAQRKALRARDTVRRAEIRRKHRVAELIFATRSETLSDGEIVAAMLRYRDECQSPELRAQAKEEGDVFLLGQVARSSNRHLQ